jgi:hypothetical protein
LKAFPDLGNSIKAAIGHQTEAKRCVKEYYDALDPNWANHSTYADVIQGAIKAGLPPESQFLAFKAN